MGLVTDMCRALEVNIAPVLDEVMNTFVQSLQVCSSAPVEYQKPFPLLQLSRKVNHSCVQSPRLDKDVKVTILGCFGDIALAIGEHFERYIHIVMSMLKDASTAAVVTNPVSTISTTFWSWSLVCNCNCGVVKAKK